MIIAIVVLFVAVAVLFIAIISYSSQANADFRRAFDKAEYAKSLAGKTHTELRDRCNELANIIKQLADAQGYSLEVERGVSFTLASILGGEKPKWSEKLVLRKKEAQRAGTSSKRSRRKSR